MGRIPTIERVVARRPCWSAITRGDQLDVVVRWPDSDYAQRIGKPITLRIQMKNADLYSFWTA